MKKITYKNIATRDELIARVENGVLSVGCFLNDIRRFLSAVKTENHTLEVIVNYSSKYGNTNKIFFI